MTQQTDDKQNTGIIRKETIYRENELNKKLEQTTVQLLTSRSQNVKILMSHQKTENEMLFQKQKQSDL